VMSRVASDVVRPWSIGAEGGATRPIYSITLCGNVIWVTVKIEAAGSCPYVVPVVFKQQVATIVGPTSRVVVVQGRSHGLDLVEERMMVG
jgi:hypothetical protein